MADCSVAKQLIAKLYSQQIGRSVKDWTIVICAMFTTGRVTCDCG
jgi:hypothetical protein